MVKPVAPGISNDDIPENRGNNRINDNGNEPAPQFVAGARRRTGVGFNRSQIQQDGAFIYRDFLDNEFQRRNLPDPSQIIPPGTAYHSL